MVSATSRSSCAGTDLRPATAATCASTNAAASFVNEGVEWMVASATARARQAGTRPAWTCAHNRGQAVAQLEGVADELLRRRGRDAEDAAELGDAELRHQRRTLAGDGLLVLAPADGERRGVVDRLRRVQVGPACAASDEQVGGGAVLGGLARRGCEREQVASGEVLDPTCLRSRQSLDHVFDPSRGVRQPPVSRPGWMRLPVSPTSRPLRGQPAEETPHRAQLSDWTRTRLIHELSPMS